MALKSSIHKFHIALSDFNSNHFEQLDLTLAQHPSETPERLMARLLAFCLNIQEGLSFSKGLSTPEEPDIWLKNLHGDIELWIEVGEPSPERIKKASRLAKKVKVYSFNTKSDTWWSQESKHFNKLKADIFQFAWESIHTISQNIEHGKEIGISIDEQSLDITIANVNISLELKILNKV